MITMKFGGTSMGSAPMIATVGGIVKDNISSGNEPFVVVSAMSGVTDQLLSAAKFAVANKQEEMQKVISKLRYQHLETAKALVKDDYLSNKIELYINGEIDHFRDFLSAISIIGEISPLSHDEIVSLGEKLSAALLAYHLQSEGSSAEYVDLSRIVKGHFDHIDSDFFDSVENEIKDLLTPLKKAKKTPIMTGFFGKIPGGIIHGVGRGYSDFTAALVGAAFHSKEIQIWTDVDGLLSADPRLVKYTCVLSEVSFDEAGELAQFGAKVLHPQTVWPAVKKNIPVRIKNTMNTNAIGTLITRDGAKSPHLCKSIASKKGVTVITLTTSKMLMAVGFLADVFTIFKKYNISVDMIATGEISVTLTVNHPLDEIPKRVFHELEVFSKVEILKDQAIICAVGTELRHRKGVAAKIFEAIADAGISVKAISQSALEINISCIIDESESEKALTALHKVIFEEKS